MGRRNPKAFEKPATTRCAVYTRKSTVEGLDKDFNTLVAQREAAEAYIESQKQQGWICLPDRYDDGGFSGATLERPALERLLQDIEAGRVDCVVVYKVDRLSRSLLDFTRLVDLLDRQGVTFVSITQQFQTTTSMGRLTLNVLLSFAQFEREIIAERTRDKMAAARRKGKWVGGFPILGYDVDPGGGRLLVNLKEAERVRTIFDLYLKLRSLDKVLRELDRREWRTKRWTIRKGRVRGGNRFPKSTLSHLLQHPYYVGRVRYRGEVYEGEHEAIVDGDVFARVQRRLKRRPGQGRGRRPSEALLQGLLECAACGASMTPGYTAKSTKRYRYYLCTSALREGRETCPAPSLSAPEIEAWVVGRLRAIAQEGAPATQRDGPIASRALQMSCGAVMAGWEGSSPQERRAALGRIVARISYNAREGQARVIFRGENGESGERTFPVVIPSRRKPDCGKNGGDTPAKNGSVPRVARLMALALHFDGLLCDGVVKSYAELARLGHVTRPRITQIMNLLNLAPDIQEQVLFLPRTQKGRSRITERHLRRIATLASWADQRTEVAGLCSR